MPSLITSELAFPGQLSSISDYEQPHSNESDHSHKSTSPESDTHTPISFSCIDECEAEVDDRTKKRPRHKRQGRVVNALRQQYNINNWNSSKSNLNLNLAPSSSSASLSSYALQASLNFHLVHVSLMTLQFVSSDGWHDLHAALGDLRLVGSRVDDAYLETLVACAAALGARTSNHSAITGLTKAEMEEMGEDGGLNLSLGKRREAACLALSNRAMSLAEEGGLLKENSARARTLSRFMRAIFTCLMPTHPHSRTLTVAIRSQLNSAESDSESDRDAKMLLFYDACTSYTLKDAPLCTEADVLNFGGVASADELLALGMPKAFDAMGQTWTETAIVALRQLCKLQLSKPIPTHELEPTFTKLGQLGDMCLSILPQIGQMCYDVFDTDVDGDRELAIMKLMSQFEVALYTQAKKHVKGRNVSLWTTSQVRFVQYAAILTRTIAKHKPSQTATHLAANQLMVFETIPEWTRLVVDSAAQHAAGEGPLLAARFTTLDLATIRRATRLGATVFAALADRDRELTQLVEDRIITQPLEAQALTSGELEGTMNVAQDARADLMVSRAMRDILAS